MSDTAWPPLPLAEWQPTYETLHLWTQVVGKIRIATTPLINHWWNSTLYLTARGLTTSPMPFGEMWRRGGAPASTSSAAAFQIAFDFIDHALLIDTSQGGHQQLDLRPQACADFYGSVMAALAKLGIDVQISPVTSEIPSPVRLDEDREHSSYDAEYANRWWRATLSAALVMEEFRARFIGKCSPVHFFWGSFDLAVTRFSGRRAPPRPGADAVTRESYSHEVSSCGFWPGGGAVDDAAFYSYAAPQPEGFDRALPGYNRTLGESILMYDDVRRSASPRDTLLDFFQSTYEAAANLGHWDRAELERK